MFAAALRRNARYRAFNQFQQGLLHTFAGYVARDGRIVAFAWNFIDFIDIDDAALGFFNVKITFTQKFGDDLFDVFTDITGFG